ncbi:MAG: hypothetical protein RI907_1482 [Pseudomonadota bacterium]|jgi:hypothetical protein
MHPLNASLAALASVLLWAASAPSWAGDRLLGTSGVSQIEGAAGGGLTTWAVIGGHGSSDQVGATAFATHIRTQGEFNLNIQGVAVGVHNRVELSAARWDFAFGRTVPGQSAQMNVFGAKVRLLGDAVYDQDLWWPQLSVGLQHKRNQDFSLVPTLLGAKRADDTDAYLAATKVWLGAAAGRNVLANVTLRATRGNQFGLLGFGGDQGDSRQLMPELALAVLLRDNLALGSEWRAKPDRLSVFKEEAAWDVFVAWFAHRNLSLTAAWLQLGNIADQPRQRSLYLSAQVGF